jgi:hypothetical protein
VISEDLLELRKANLLLCEVYPWSFKLAQAITEEHWKREYHKQQSPLPLKQAEDYALFSYCERQQAWRTKLDEMIVLWLARPVNEAYRLELANTCRWFT